MAEKMKSNEFVERLKRVATDCKTLYVMGGIGFPLNARGKQRAYTNNWNKDPQRVAMIEAAPADCFAFDCVCLLKSVLWGFVGDPTKIYGGATYASNGVPDISADAMINKCTGISTDFSKLVPGEALWVPGHIGVYIGDGLAVECTPIWKNCVQITACNCDKSGYPRRNWSKHGKLPYVQYVVDSPRDIIMELKGSKHNVEINEVEKAVNALTKVRTHPELHSLYWILYKLVNGNG